MAYHRVILRFQQFLTKREQKGVPQCLGTAECLVQRVFLKPQYALHLLNIYVA